MNVDVQAWAESGRFRRDLLDRLGFLELRIPSLRERRADIIPLFRQFLRISGGDSDGAEPLEVGPAVEEILLGYDWP